LQAALADRYSITRELGRGATATVYLAKDLRYPGTWVAIKVLAEEFALVVRTERFIAEIQTAARLTHPHILKLTDSGSAGGLLYYVMPYIDGGTVADRLARDGPLPVEEAVRLAREVADALDYAHSQNVTHRDIKPGNILLASGHAWVADFGIASAIEVGDTGLTATGAHLGTPPYMSPEQVTGDRKVDGRTDIYSLGCTLYEMLCGETPFQGPDIQTMLRRRLVEPPPSVRSARPDVPAWLDAVLLVALATDAADRFPTGRAFEQALAQQGEGLVPRPGPVPVPEPWRIPRRVLAALVPVSLTVVVVVVWGATRDAKLDPRTVVVLPPEGDSTAPAARYGEALMRDALGAWKGIDMVERGKVWEALGSRRRPLDTRGALGVARALKAGRYIRTEVSPFGDSTRVHTTLYDAGSDGAVLREVTIKLGPGLLGATSAYAGLVDQLLFGPSTEPTATHSYPARLAFDRGQAAVQEWELGKADSAFRQATDADPDYARAHLWLAQVRFWGDSPLPAWRSSAERAATARSALTSLEGALSTALLEFGRGNVVQACAVWDRLTGSNAQDFAAWYGLASCLKSDDVVVRDEASPSGWRFRSSYHHALKAYQRAFQLVPTIHRSLRESGYETLRLLLMTGDFRRSGRGVAPDTGHFVARGIWRGDSLVFIPRRIGVTDRRTLATREEIDLAVRQRRRWFKEIATAWVAAFPHSAGAHEAMAVSLEMLGEPSSIDTLRRARELETSPSERARLAEAEVWLRLKFSIPVDLEGVKAARVLADSLLNERVAASPLEYRLLSTLAALTGRGFLAAALSRGGAAELGAPGPIASIAPSLLAFAALGGPIDSLEILESALETAIDNLIPEEDRASLRMQWLARAAQLSFPVYRFRSIGQLRGRGNPLIDAQDAYVRNDTASVRRIFADVQRIREPFSPADFSLDALYPETALLAVLGDYRAAIRWCDPTLNALAGTAPQVFSDAARAGALVHAMALRAELARRAGDGVSAARWARVVAILWSDADPFLKPVVQRMRELTN
jgi:protein kinase-like protein